LDSYKQREAAIKVYTEKAENEATDIIARATHTGQIYVLKVKEILEIVTQSVQR
jgi:hypothetical protein